MTIRSHRAAACALLFAGAAAATARPFRFDDLARVQRVGGFSLSPDGQWIAYAVSTPDVPANSSRAAIWLAPSAGGAARRLTSGEKRDSDPAFSPDGKKIAFLSNREGGSQIWVVNLAGGEPQKATAFPTEVNGFRWAPDASAFVVVSDVFPDCPDTACLAARVEKREKATVKARVAERLLFRHWDVWQEGLRTHLWKVPLAAGTAAIDLTLGDYDAPPFAVGGGDGYDISPDGKDFVYASNPDRLQATSTNGDLCVVPFSGGGRPLDLTASNPAYDGSPHFSPDGSGSRTARRSGPEWKPTVSL